MENWKQVTYYQMCENGTGLTTCKYVTKSKQFFFFFLFFLAFASNSAQLDCHFTENIPNEKIFSVQSFENGMEGYKLRMVVEK